MDARTKRGCLWAAIGAGVLVLIVGAALFGGAAWLVYQSSSIQSTPATSQRAGEELEAVRTRFADQTPLIAIDAEEHASIVTRKRATDKTLESLHVLAFDPDEKQLKRITVPFWVLRLSPGSGELKIDDQTLGLRNTRITIREVEEAGPGLLIDHEGRDGRRVIVWTE